MYGDIIVVMFKEESALRYIDRLCSNFHIPYVFKNTEVGPLKLYKFTLLGARGTGICDVFKGGCPYFVLAHD